MANPILSEKVFREASVNTYEGTMTAKGTAIKSLVLIFMVLAGASYTWKVFSDTLNPALVTPWMWGGMIGGLITGLIINFKPKLAQYLSPVYAVLQGLFLGAISAIYNNAFSESAPGIVMNATLLTIVTALAMFLIYRSNIIKVDGRFARIITVAIGAIMFYYIVSIILGLLGVNLTMLHNSSPLSIGISLVIVVVAAFSLLVDFEFITRASQSGAPKYMEWYGAFALMVTLIWLYLEILKLLAKVASRRE